MTPRPQTRWLRARLSGLIVALEYVSSATILMMMLLTFADVVGRYVFAQPILGSSEMISALLAVTIFAGLGITNARDEHIVVELVDHRFRALAPRTYEAMIQLFSIAAMSLVAYVLGVSALHAYETSHRTFVLEIPTFWITGTVSALAAISVVSQVAGVVLILSGDRIDPQR